MADLNDDIQKRKLEDLRHEEEEDLVKILAEAKYNLPSIDLGNIGVENEALRAVSESEARRLKVGPFKVLGKAVHIAILSPDNPEIISLKRDLEHRGYQPIFYMASHASVEKVWMRYSEISNATTSRAGSMDIPGDIIIAISNRIHEMKDVKLLIDETKNETSSHRISKIIDVLLAGAISLGASDVHIEPEEELVRIRYRLDGVLQDIIFLDHKTHHFINSRIKLLSAMKLTTENQAQDGRFSIWIGADEISMRVSVIPGAYGESIVMRILNPKSIRVPLEEMGIDPKLFEVINESIQKPNGLILITGPTGSGKTTTLYAFLQKIYSASIKIITIEDPIEYHLQGITQTQVDSDKGYHFIHGLRAALRQDPDVIMVGEIRDAETAKIAVESALTGHLVFSTLHTNNAAGVIPRLIDLEVNPKIMVSALTLSMAQRLVRRLCKECKKQVKPTVEQEKTLRTILKHAHETGKNLPAYNLTPDQELFIWEPVGCSKCGNIGYHKQIGIFEAIYTNEEIEKIIPQNPSEREIKRVAEKQGIFDMREDGVVKILTGITSMEEVQTVVDLEEEL
jgi:type IV pilus assembly protein PilB